MGWLVALAGWAFIAATTLPPAPVSRVYARYCLLCGEFGAADALQNLLLFLPLGLGLGLAGLRAHRALAVVLLSTLLVESLQLTLIPGRDASIGDLVTNSLGGALGVLMGARYRSWLLPGPAAARRLARLGVAAWLLAMGFSTWALGLERMSGPFTALWWPRADDAYRGESIAVEVAGVATTNRETIEPAAIARAIDARDFPVRVVLLPGPLTDAEDAVLEVLDPEERQLHSLAVDGRDLVLDFYTRAATLTLRYPRLRLVDALPPPAPPGEADTLVIDGALRGGSMWLRVTAPGWRAERTLPLGPATGWLALFPFGYATSARVALVTVCWLFALLLPVGYWSGRDVGLAARTRAAGQGATFALLGAAGVIAFWLLPLGLQVAPLPAHLLPVALAGVATGWLVGRWSARGSGRGEAPPSQLLDPRHTPLRPGERIIAKNPHARPDPASDAAGRLPA